MSIHFTYFFILNIYQGEVNQNPRNRMSYNITNMLQGKLVSQKMVLLRFIILLWPYSIHTVKTLVSYTSNYFRYTLNVNVRMLGYNKIKT